jgi:hypothetical protein
MNTASALPTRIRCSAQASGSPVSRAEVSTVNRCLAERSPCRVAKAGEPAAQAGAGSSSKKGAGRARERNLSLAR